MKKYIDLLKLAREAIKCRLEESVIKISEKIKKKYSKKQACFVTLTKNNDLRGCIGSLDAHQELWKNIINNAINAGFNDSRFPSLDKNELNKIRIEISILSVPEKIDYKNKEDLLKKINNKIGIILKKGSYCSTFLPQVWEQIPEKTDFLEHLSIKAGLKKDDWKDSEFWFYRVKSIKE
jgi:AmmeMemoRadiSam system protein A